MHVGKTSLIDELHRTIIRQRGLFARGKFDLLKRDSSCLLLAFRHLIVQLLAVDPVTSRVRVLRALGAEAAVLCEVMPELARLLGDQPPPSKLSASDVATRFNLVFCRFVAALATSRSPLTLFIDDLQCKICVYSRFCVGALCSLADSLHVCQCARVLSLQGPTRARCASCARFWITNQHACSSSSPFAATKLMLHIR